MRHSRSLALLVAPAFAFAAAGAAEEIDFNRDIRPILSDKCYYCHGPDKENREGDLRLDIRQEAIDAYAIIPGDPMDSELVLRIFSDDPDEVMPRPSSHKTLAEAEKRLLVDWIKSGAHYDEHWSYSPVEKPVFDSIDAVVAHELEQRQLDFSPEADKRALIRRVSLDLIGLPPTPEEVDAFLADKAPDGYERLVDRLLASPRYGERMAIPWLDAVRYADTVGYHGDQERDASPYRDYVIQAFNENKPYDAFTIEQIAGDLLPNATLKQKVAASYNRLNQISREGGIQDKEYVKKYQAERVRTTATAWLGSTLACAECHDHKFDPFTTKDFYRMAAFFSDILEKGAYTDDGSYQEDLAPYLTDPLENEGWFGPELTVPNDTFHPDPQEIRAQIRTRQARLAQGSPKAESEFQDWLRKQSVLATKSAENRYALPFGQSDESIPIRSEFNQPANLAAIQFEARSDNGSASSVGLKIEFAVGDQRQAKVFAWGHNIRANDLPLTRVGDNLYASQWTRLELPIDAMELPSGAQLVAITPLKENRAKFRSFELRTLYLGSKAGSLSELGKALLYTYIRDPQSNIDALRAEYFVNHAETFAPQRKEIAALQGELDGVRYAPLTISAKPREVKVLPRGNWMDDCGETVLPASPSFLPNPIESTKKERLTRLDLAKWIVHPDNPLASRAFVNRLWALFFEAPLSNAPEDLGLQGEYPPYPELLDWLAHEFVDSNWDIKHVVRTIVLSRTYRQTSDVSPEHIDRDPKNRLLARQSPVRLPAELIRDNALSISGLLDTRMGGPSVRPYQPESYYANLNFPKRIYQSDTDSDQYRRGVYMHWQRTFLHPMMVAFDANARDECSVKRDLSNTPLQALNLLNDPTHIEAARAFAERIRHAAKGDKRRIQIAYRYALAREPSTDETKTLEAFLKRERQRFKRQENLADPFLQIGNRALGEPDHELAALTSLCRAILNLHETITRY